MMCVCVCTDRADMGVMDCADWRPVMELVLNNNHNLIDPFGRRRPRLHLLLFTTKEESSIIQNPCTLTWIDVLLFSRLHSAVTVAEQDKRGQDSRTAETWTDLNRWSSEKFRVCAESLPKFPEVSGWICLRCFTLSWQQLIRLDVEAGTCLQIIQISSHRMEEWVYFWWQLGSPT